jgi:hypothetical protein
MISSYCRRPTAEDFRSIDIRDIAPSQLVQPGLIGIWRWNRAGEEVASVHFRTEGSAFVLAYSSGIGTKIRQRVPLTWTACALGGQRPWFRCSCGRRVAILYAVGGGLFCRRCCGLAYESQRERPDLRSIRRAQAIRQRLDGNLDIFSGFPPKPPGMHWKSYWLRARGLVEDRRAIEGLRTFLRRSA